MATRGGAKSRLIQRASDIDLSWLDDVETLGLTAGASAPEILVREIIDHLSQFFTISEEQVTTAEETVIFKLPRGLTETDD